MIVLESMRCGCWCILCGELRRRFRSVCVIGCNWLVILAKGAVEVRLDYGQGWTIRNDRCVLFVCRCCVGFWGVV